MYPKKTPKQAQADQEAKKLISKQQREQLKAMVADKFQSKYPNKDPQALQEKVDNFFEKQQTLTSQALKQLDSNIAHSEKDKKSAIDQDRDDMSVKSGVSKMSGATDFAPHKTDRSSGSVKGNKIIDLNMKTKKETNKNAYKNEEEEWADIYKNNNQVYKAEAELEQERRAFEKVKFKHQLDEQVAIKKEKKHFEESLKQVDLAQTLMRVAKEETKEQKKVQIAKAKMMFEKEMRDKQIKENKAQKKQEIKEEKQLDRYIMKRIREEQIEEELAARKRKEEDYAYYRKMLLENEEKRGIMMQELAKERQEEIRLIEEQNRLIEERDKARAEQAKAHDNKIRNILESAKGLLGKPSDERERRQDMKVKRWADKKDQEELAEEEREKQAIWKKKLDVKSYLDQQVEDKKIRKAEEKIERDEQAKIWHNSSEKFVEWEKMKADTRKEQMKVYGDVLQKQMHEKIEERRITDKLFDLRATQYESKRAAAITN